ncbi:hypothetical protein GA0070613_5912 [Micromonospora inositola]|uniref:Uncharacterized protein n=1 Tax=Micromonospora inositola TaxID=47865 RepID=A0A1C5JZQ6_9ACTN|nr:hypothetical protein GA0070613_5912 [Micromonospora inositola]
MTGFGRRSRGVEKVAEDQVVADPDDERGHRLGTGRRHHPAEPLLATDVPGH